MKAKAIALCAIVLPCFVNIPLRGDVTYIEPVGLVSIQGYSTSSGDSLSCEALSLYPPGAESGSQGVDFHYEYPWEPYPDTALKYYWGSAQNTLVLTSSGIIAEGAAAEGGPFFCGGYWSQSALSALDVVFAIDAPREFLLTGSLFAGGDHGGTNHGVHNASVVLSNAEGSIFSASVTDAFGSDWAELYLNGTLALSPGTYVLNLSASAEGFYTPYSGSWGIGGGGEARYSIQLVVIPAPGAIALAAVGMSAVGWLRRRRTL